MKRKKANLIIVARKEKKMKMEWKLSNKTLLTMLLFDSLVLVLAS
jgi:hypothetical protein